MATRKHTHKFSEHFVGAEKDDGGFRILHRSGLNDNDQKLFRRGSMLKVKSFFPVPGPKLFSGKGRFRRLIASSPHPGYADEYIEKTDLVEIFIVRVEKRDEKEEIIIGPAEEFLSSLKEIQIASPGKFVAHGRRGEQVKVGFWTRWIFVYRDCGKISGRIYNSSEDVFLCLEDLQ